MAHQLYLLVFGTALYFFVFAKKLKITLKKANVRNWTLSDCTLTAVKLEGICEGRITVVFPSRADVEINDELAWLPIFVKRSRTDESYFLLPLLLVLVPSCAVSGLRFFTSGDVLNSPLIFFFLL